MDGMTRILLRCTGGAAAAKVMGVITAGMAGIPVEVTFDECWNGLTKRLIARCDGTEMAAVIGPEGTAVLPWECLTEDGKLQLGVDGWDAAGTLRIPTRWADCGRVLPSVAGAVPEGSRDPTPEEIQQLLTMAEKCREQAAEARAAARSAAQTAENLLEDAGNGRFDGAPGKDGLPGKDGTSVGILRTEESTQSGGINTVVFTDGSRLHIRNGAAPVLRMGSVQTLPAGSPAEASLTGTPEAPVLNLGIPRGSTVSDAHINSLIDAKIGPIDTALDAMIAKGAALQ